VTRVAALLACLAMLASCRGDHAGGTAAPSSPAGSGAPAAPSGERQCLPLLICTEWAGCALVARDAQSQWTVVAADRVQPGEPVRVENACNTGGTCTAAKASPRDVQCPPIEIPPLIAPPGYTCAMNGASCHAMPR
jgi:hypothetical protein